MKVKEPKGRRPKNTIVNGLNGKALWKITRWPDGQVSLEDLDAPAGSDCVVRFESSQIATAVGLAILGRSS